MSQWIDQKWQFVMSLYSTLDLPTVIENFMTGVQAEIHCDSLEYHNSIIAKHIAIGVESEFSLSYPLYYQQKYLGDISITRCEKFTLRETDLFEELICLLTNPLSNAIQYHQALQQALLDPLTGVANRTGLLTTLARELDLAARQERPLSILSLDIDHFKEINDTAGHLAGDYYLKTFTEKLIEICRDSDLIYRIGGEEFLIVLSNTDEFGARLLAKRIIRGIADLECEYKDKKLSTTVSIGITTESDCINDVSEVLERVDSALYLAKQQGRNQAVHFEGQTV